MPQFVRRVGTEDGAQQTRGLADLVRQRQPHLDEARFIDSVLQNLRRGDLLLLIIGDGIREGVGAITQFLEGHGTLHFTFGLVEMAIHRMPDGGHLIQPRVLVQSTIIRRIVVQLQGSGMEAHEEPADEKDEVNIDDEDMERNRERFARFWTEFLQKLELDDKSQPVPKPAKSTNLYFEMPSGSNAWISAYLAQTRSRVGVYLTFSKGPIGDRIFERLKEDSNSINQALGVPDVVWEAMERSTGFLRGNLSPESSSRSTERKCELGSQTASTVS